MIDRLANERTRLDIEAAVGRRILEITNRHHDVESLLRECLPVLQELTRCDAVGLRVLGEQQTARFVATVGYEEGFLQQEGELDLHADRCLCAAVLTNDLDRESPGVTAAGSFYSDSTSGLLQRIKAERRLALRNTCNRYGFESVALVPIRSEGRILGLIHVADPRQGRVDEQLVALLEQVALQIGTAVGRIQAQAALREREGQLARADRLASVGMLAAGVAHEINNPLTYILYNLETATEDLPQLIDALQRCRDAISDGGENPAAAAAEALAHPDPAWAADLLERLKEAHEGAARVRDIVADLRLFARVGDESVGPVRLEDPASMAMTLAHNEIKYRAKLVKDLRPTPPIEADEGRLAHVFLNLLVNAAHAIDEGDAGSNEIRLRTWADADAVYAEVQDTGKGIDEAHIERIFDPFYSTKPRHLSSGLGLSIAHTTVLRYGGTLSVESTPGVGTRFTMRFPIVVAPDTPETPETPAPSGPLVRHVSPSRARILIADDDEFVRRLIERTLGRDNDVVCAASGREARDLLLQDDGFDAVLCDLMMPEMSGMDLHAWLTEHRPDLARRTAFITGGVFTERARRFLAEVPNPSLNKPFGPAALRSMIRGILED